MGCSLNHEKIWTRILNITEKYWTLLHKILNPGFKIIWPEILNPSLVFICSWTGVQDISSRGRCRYLAAKYYQTLYLFSIFTGEGSHNMTTDLLRLIFICYMKGGSKHHECEILTTPSLPPFSHLHVLLNYI